jgi:transposase InsO family protein
MKFKGIRTDNGSEFINKIFVDFLDKNNIKKILSEPAKPQSNGMIERANATIKEVIQKSLEINENYDWVLNLQKLVENINKSQHRITGFTPNKIENAVLENDEELLNRAQENELKTKSGNISKVKFYVRDFVKII